MDIARRDRIGGCLSVEWSSRLVSITEYMASMMFLVGILAGIYYEGLIYILLVIPVAFNVFATTRFGSAVYLKDPKRIRIYQAWKLMTIVFVVVIVPVLIFVPRYHISQLKLKGNHLERQEQISHLEKIHRQIVMGCIVLSIYTLVEVYFLIIAIQLQKYWIKLLNRNPLPSLTPRDNETSFQRLPSAMADDGVTVQSCDVGRY